MVGPESCAENRGQKAVDTGLLAVDAPNCPTTHTLDFFFFPHTQGEGRETPRQGQGAAPLIAALVNIDSRPGETVFLVGP